MPTMVRQWITSNTRHTSTAAAAAAAVFGQQRCQLQSNGHHTSSMNSVRYGEMETIGSIWQRESLLISQTYSTSGYISFPSSMTTRTAKHNRHSGNNLVSCRRCIQNNGFEGNGKTVDEVGPSFEKANAPINVHVEPTTRTLINDIPILQRAIAHDLATAIVSPQVSFAG